MKKLLFFTLLMAFAIILSNGLYGQKTEFNGTWKLDVTKSILPDYTPVLARIEVNIVGDSLLTERFYDTGDGQEYPFTENLTLDGKEYNIFIYDMPRKSKASWSDQDGLKIESTTSPIDGDFISVETWKVDAEAKTLTISFKNSMAGNEGTGTFFLKLSD
jgi:hypothetical protein